MMLYMILDDQTNLSNKFRISMHQPTKHKTKQTPPHTTPHTHQHTLTLYTKLFNNIIHTHIILLYISLGLGGIWDFISLGFGFRVWGLTLINNLRLSGFISLSHCFQ